MDRRRFLAGVTATGLTTAGNATEPLMAGATPAYQAWEVGDRNGLGALRLSRRNPLAARPGYAVIEVRYSAINARDLGIVGGPFPPGIESSRVPLADGAGQVIAVGEGVEKVAVGDRVIANHFVRWVDGEWTPRHYEHDVSTSIDGWLAEYITLPATGLVKIPDNVTDQTACTLTGAGVTAWHALYEVARLQPGETVLSLGTGGVSTFGLLLAKRSGAKVVMTSSSDSKLEKVRALGADFTVNYKNNPDWGKEVFEKTGGADVVLENVGRKTLDQSMLGTAVNGRIVMIGTGPLPKQLPALPELFQKNIMIKAISNGSNRMLTDFIAAVSANGIEPVIGRVFSFDEAREAFAYMARSSHIGKVVIKH